MGLSDEIFDVVNDQDQVVRQETRGDVHANDWLHRAVHLWVFRPNGSLVLQMRSKTKDQYPSTWTSSASGHVDAGETYQAAALRELDEELGLKCSASDLREIVKLPASSETAYEFTMLYVIQTDQELRPDPDEVAYLQEWALQDLREELEKAESELSPPLKALLAWWGKHHADND